MLPPNDTADADDDVADDDDANVDVDGGGVDDDGQAVLADWQPPLSGAMACYSTQTCEESKHVWLLLEADCKNTIFDIWLLFYKFESVCPIKQCDV